jgi:LacI family transcriptional regulator
MIKGTPVQNDRIVLKPVLLARDSVAAIKLPTKTRSSDFSDAAKREVRIQHRQS